MPTYQPDQLVPAMAFGGALIGISAAKAETIDAIAITPASSILRINAPNRANNSGFYIAEGYPFENDQIAFY
jgi:hypothetical protein